MLFAALVAAACATRGDDRAWFTYQVAGETASAHARYAKAEDLLGRARAEANDPAQRVRTHLGLARLARDQGDVTRAQLELTTARADADALPANAPEHVRVALEAAWIELAAGSPRSAADAFGRVEAEALERFGETDPAAGFAAAGRGEALRRAGDLDGSARALGVALDRFTGTASADHVKPADPLGLVAAETSLGKLAHERGELDAARAALREAAAIAGIELGTDHPLLADVLSELALVELALGDREAATRAADRAVAIASSRLPAAHPIRLAAAAAQERCAEAP
jgi:tetratricopeptide (TPR) repeat protein